MEVKVVLDGSIDFTPELINGYDEVEADTVLAKRHLEPNHGNISVPVLGY